MILRAAAEGVVGTDTEGRVVLVNPAAAQILGFRASDLGGKELHPLVLHSRADGEPFPYEESPLADTLRSGRKHRVRGQVLWPRTGPVPVDLTTAPVRDGDQLVGAVMTFTDRRRAAARAARASLRGPLDELRRELAAWPRTTPGSCGPRPTRSCTTSRPGTRASPRSSTTSSPTSGSTTGAEEHHPDESDAGRGRRRRCGRGGRADRARDACSSPCTPRPSRPRSTRAARPPRSRTSSRTSPGVDSTGNSPGRGRRVTWTTRSSWRRRSAAMVVRIEVRGPYAGGDPVHEPIVRGIVRAHGGVLQTHEVPGMSGSAYVLEVPISAAADGSDGRGAGAGPAGPQPVGPAAMGVVPPQGMAAQPQPPAAGGRRRGSPAQEPGGPYQAQQGGQGGGGRSALALPPAAADANGPVAAGPGESAMPALPATRTPEQQQPGWGEAPQGAIENESAQAKGRRARRPLSEAPNRSVPEQPQPQQQPQPQRQAQPQPQAQPAGEPGAARSPFALPPAAADRAPQPGALPPELGPAGPTGLVPAQHGARDARVGAPRAQGQPQGGGLAVRGEPVPPGGTARNGSWPSGPGQAPQQPQQAPAQHGQGQNQGQGRPQAPRPGTAGPGAGAGGSAMPALPAARAPEQQQPAWDEAPQDSSGQQAAQPTGRRRARRPLSEEQPEPTPGAQPPAQQLPPEMPRNAPQAPPQSAAPQNAPQGAPQSAPHGAQQGADTTQGRAFSVRTLGQGVPFAQQVSERQRTPQPQQPQQSQQPQGQPQAPRRPPAVRPPRGRAGAASWPPGPIGRSRTPRRSWSPPATAPTPRPRRRPPARPGPRPARSRAPSPARDRSRPVRPRRTVRGAPSRSAPRTRERRDRSRWTGPMGPSRSSTTAPRRPTTNCPRSRWTTRAASWCGPRPTCPRSRR
jgi:PAS domain S-box-containing protein